MIRIFVPMAPPTANLLWRRSGSRTYLSPRAETFYRLVRVAVMEVGGVPSSWKEVDVEIYVSPTQRNGDVDNRIKGALDALTRARFWEDDRIVASVKAQFVKPSPKGGTWIEIRKAAIPKYADLELPRRSSAELREE